MLYASIFIRRVFQNIFRINVCSEKKPDTFSTELNASRLDDRKIVKSESGARQRQPSFLGTSQHRKTSSENKEKIHTRTHKHNMRGKKKRKKTKYIVDMPGKITSRLYYRLQKTTLKKVSMKNVVCMYLLVCNLKEGRYLIVRSLLRKKSVHR